jgi:hypothetical protein
MRSSVFIAVKARGDGAQFKARASEQRRQRQRRALW